MSVDVAAPLRALLPSVPPTPRATALPAARSPSATLHLFRSPFLLPLGWMARGGGGGKKSRTGGGGGKKKVAARRKKKPVTSSDSSEDGAAVGSDGSLSMAGELDRLREQLRMSNLSVRDVDPDGNCLFRAGTLMRSLHLCVFSRVLVTSTEALDVCWPSVC